MSKDISLLDNINFLLKVNYDNNLLSLNEYNQIKSSLSHLSKDSLYKIFQKLKYLKDKNTSQYNVSTDQLVAQQNQLIQQQNMINQQQRQINDIVNLFNNDFSLEDNFDNDNITNRFHNENNGRSSLINTQQEYLPRMNQPMLQNKQPRNNFENEFQNRFQQRNELNQNYNPSTNNQEYGINVFNKDDFYDRENKRERDFLKSQNLREKIFKEKARNRREEFERGLQDANNNFDPYQILQCSPNSDIEQIKVAYKKLALKYHPDRGGNSEDFQILTKAYLSLVEDYKKKEVAKNYMDLKNSSSEYMEDQQNNPKQNINMNNENFNLKLFNKIYMENRISDPNDEGYDNWIKKSDNEQEETQLFSDKFNINVFNSVFENSKNSNNTQDIVEYKDPIPTNINNELAYNNLGEGNIKDFSGGSNSLNYTDLKYAHTKTKLIDTRNINIKNYKDVEDLEKERSNISYQMNEKDRYEYELQREREDMEEIERRKRLKDYENNHFQNYNKVHKMLIDNK